MGTRSGAVVAIIVAASVLGSPGRALADETDNLTCRNRPLASCSPTQYACLAASSGWTRSITSFREGLEHWRAVRQRGDDITTVMTRELGTPGRQWHWNEYGLKGLSVTGVLAYADLAASYSGFTFWSDLLSIGRAGSFVAYDHRATAFVQRRAFSFTEYVNDAWDEGVNYSVFHQTLAKQVEAALLDRAMTLPVTDCRFLADLPQARLYVNPACLTVG